MQAKDLLLVAGGVALGYLIFKKDLFKSKKNGISDVKIGAEGIVSGTEEFVTGGIKGVRDIKNTVIDLINPKQTDCEKRWTEFATTARFESQEAMEKAKSEFIANCLLTK
jgi:hypothetical protein